MRIWTAVGQCFALAQVPGGGSANQQPQCSNNGADSIVVLFTATFSSGSCAHTRSAGTPIMPKKVRLCIPVFYLALRIFPLATH